MGRKRFCLLLVIALIAALCFLNPKVHAEYPQNGYQWSDAGMATKRSMCIDFIQQRVGESAWHNNNHRAAATLYCIERIDDYYQEHPNDHSLEQAKKESLDDVIRFLLTGQREQM
jgi:hypothetical protein